MGLSFFVPCSIFFLSRILLIRTPADMVSMGVLMLIWILNSFQRRHWVRTVLSSACCVSMCVFSLWLNALNVYFDPAYLVCAVIWLVLLIHPFFYTLPCNVDK